MAADERTSFIWNTFLFCVLINLSTPCLSATLTGYAVQVSEGVQVTNGRYDVHIGKEMPFVLFGEGLSADILLSLTTAEKKTGADCEDLDKVLISQISVANDSNNVGFVSFVFDSSALYMFCIKERSNTSAGKWIHQGSNSWLQVSTWADNTTSFIPLWLQIILIIILLTCSALFSGLNLGLMSLDKAELEILKNSGSANEKRYAKSIAPLRKRGNHLLCTILLGNVLVNNTLAILLDDLIGSGYLAIFGATAAIVVFGEIIPQAVCSRYGLAIGAKTIWFTWLFIILTFPISFPISKILDCILGEEMGVVYNRDRLRELIRVTGTDLVKDELEIIKGALELSKKTVRDVMTKLDDVYMLEYSAVLDFQTMSDIIKAGYSRIPVFEKEKENIVGLLNSKDLTFIDPDDKTPLQTVMKFYSHQLHFVFDDTKLDAMLEEFKKGRSHMAVVRTVKCEGLDPYYETLGVVTLEDIIEEIIQSEIVDETDTILDNRSKARRKVTAKDFTVFNQPDDESYPRMSPQLTLAAFQYLSTSVAPFRNELVSDAALHRLLKCNIMVDLKLNSAFPSSQLIYEMGKPVDYFVMILEGRVQVSVGKEHLIFEGGPFMCFATQALTGEDCSNAENADANKPLLYTPDYTVRVITNVQYLCIRRSHYIALRRATMMERQPRTVQAPDTTSDNFNIEWQKALDNPGQVSTASLLSPDRQATSLNLEKSPSDHGLEMSVMSSNASRSFVNEELQTVKTPLLHNSGDSSLLVSPVRT